MSCFNIGALLVNSWFILSFSSKFIFCLSSQIVGDNAKGRISKRMFLSENLVCFVFFKHPFWDSPFRLITDKMKHLHAPNLHQIIYLKIYFSCLPFDLSNKKLTSWWIRIDIQLTYKFQLLAKDQGDLLHVSTQRNLTRQISSSF